MLNMATSSDVVSEIKVKDELMSQVKGNRLMGVIIENQIAQSTQYRHITFFIITRKRNFLGH